jgi:DNA repair protein RadC
VTPSPEDVVLTREIVRAGKLLRIEVLDHIIVGAGRLVSLRERGLGFRKESRNAPADPEF